jgi:excisionase family DNA binding protein
MATAIPRVPSTSRRLASIPDAAEYVGVSTKTTRRYIAAGRITGYRTGPRLIRVDLNEVDAVLLQRIPTAAGA